MHNLRRWLCTPSRTSHAPRGRSLEAHCTSLFRVALALGVHAAEVAARRKKKAKRLELCDLLMREEAALALLVSSTPLANLHEVDLSCNKLYFVPASLSVLRSLQVLRLAGNRLRSMRGIGRFKALVKADLSYNHLAAVLLEVLEMPALKKLKMAGNPLDAMPRERAAKVLASSKPKAAKAYARALLEDEAMAWRRLKVITVGDANVGKSTLIAKLQGLPVGRNISTDGIDIVDVALERPPLGRFGHSLWDFGGQDVFWSTHQFFLTGGAIYIIVVNLANFNNHIMRDWLDQVESVYRQTSQLCPKLIIGTHACELTESELQQAEQVITKAAAHAQHVFERQDGSKVIFRFTAAWTRSRTRCAALPPRTPSASETCPCATRRCICVSTSSEPRRLSLPAKTCAN
eukprot:TRINITY_DN2840_c0_g1_i1.p1 TRINITY_DN2840_c0_g1~~TRINITY_DN2840_c0_g1_i1.p1  ORF type:complete len:404 (+),score=142.11 TRINITY_DN2840_c0_g1_i1:698-1909(+)